ncbi:MAG: hypothetical protein I3273_06500 [Candidatus Moeniiplasma glomeromycotorum]|nr:hypothetical protein [Candidatus Moeniiplasma glomeromycotorum]MCE8162522.1 hypothetical protein [Candidatus Moeniiplasma glomeromycotorum]MCE8163886.1 hypothetical protein [Candidatus Moeniiplasma glomeromycotorum]MCE8166449.1 hypothetical protein [Candidatus Moeniiplasma glomeromycotorum]MCE8166934.1 hypothetical protein [Candidatus Moeniiplasma glomeromycotorum]
MTKNKKNELKIVVGSYDVRVVDETVKLMWDKLKQLKLTFRGPVPFPNHRVVVSPISSPHKHKDSQEKYEQITRWRKFFVTVPSNFTPSTLKSLLSLETPGKVNLRFVLPSQDEKEVGK